MPADTVAKLIHEWTAVDRAPKKPFRLPSGSTLVVDEAGMIGTFDLYTLMQLAERNEWRLALVGDPRQLSAVGRGGMFDDLCATGRVVELERVHRFTEPWEAKASLALRRGDQGALHTYAWHDRIVAGPLAEHVDAIAGRWMTEFAAGRSLAITTATNDHVDLINDAVQAQRLEHGHLRPETHAEIAGGAVAHVGDIVATRLNDRRLRTDLGEPVRNRDLWTVTAIDDDGRLTVTKFHGHGSVTLPTEYTVTNVRLGYAATEYGQQSVTTDASITLATGGMNARGFYVGMTRGRHDNTVHVVTETHDPAEALDALERALASDRADLPAVAHRRQLSAQDRHVEASRPAPGPRCPIPPGYNELVSEARDELATVRRVIAEGPTSRAELTVAVQRAEQAVATTKNEHAPFAALVSDAHDKVTGARESMYAASANLRAANTFTCRGAQRRSNLAARAVDEAVANLDTVREIARPTSTALHAAEEAAGRARGDLQTLAIAERYTNPERLDNAERRLDALETWGTWVSGRDVAPGRVLEAVNNLNRTSRQEVTALIVRSKAG